MSLRERHQQWPWRRHTSSSGDESLPKAAFLALCSDFLYKDLKTRPSHKLISNSGSENTRSLDSSCEFMQICDARDEYSDAVRYLTPQGSQWDRCGIGVQTVANASKFAAVNFSRIQQLAFSKQREKKVRALMCLSRDVWKIWGKIASQ